jgi:hypothetical protein
MKKEKKNLKNTTFSRPSNHNAIVFEKYVENIVSIDFIELNFRIFFVDTLINKNKPHD